MSRSNPWAARAIAERLLEAADRGMWASPPDETLSEIRDRYLALDGELEEAGQSPAGHRRPEVDGRNQDAGLEAPRR
jgi:cobalamin biosynthesis Mg chelatase CobN